MLTPSAVLGDAGMQGEPPVEQKSLPLARLPSLTHALILFLPPTHDKRERSPPRYHPHSAHRAAHPGGRSSLASIAHIALVARRCGLPKGSSHFPLDGVAAVPCGDPPDSASIPPHPHDFFNFGPNTILCPETDPRFFSEFINQTQHQAIPTSASERSLFCDQRLLPNPEGIAYLTPNPSNLFLPTPTYNVSAFGLAYPADFSSSINFASCPLPPFVPQQQFFGALPAFPTPSPLQPGPSPSDQQPGSPAGEELPNSRPEIRGAGGQTGNPKRQLRVWPHKCGFIGCNYTARYPKDVKKHQSVHFPRPSIKCTNPRCPATFTRKYNLTKHLRGKCRFQAS